MANIKRYELQYLGSKITQTQKGTEQSVPFNQCKGRFSCPRLLKQFLGEVQALIFSEDSQVIPMQSQGWDYLKTNKW